MKWLFRIIFLTFLAFLGLCVIGFFLPETETLESSLMLEADIDGIYDALSDLRTYPEWTQLAGDMSGDMSGAASDQMDWVFGGSEKGVGQSAAWQNGSEFGSLEILQATQDEFVTLRIIGPAGERYVTLAAQRQAENTIVLARVEHNLPGFPYIGRLSALRSRARAQEVTDQFLTNLSDFITGAAY